MEYQFADIKTLLLEVSHTSDKKWLTHLLSQEKSGEGARLKSPKNHLSEGRQLLHRGIRPTVPNHPQSWLRDIPALLAAHQAGRLRQQVLGGRSPAGQEGFLAGVHQGSRGGDGGQLAISNTGHGGAEL